MSTSYRLFLCALCALFVGCGDGPTLVGPNDAGNDLGGPATDVSCTAGQTECNGRCIAPLTDRANCGGCGRVCAPTEACRSGSCVAACDPGQTACNGTDGSVVCANLSTDQRNCGMCGQACTNDQVCSGGVCTFMCRAGSTECTVAGARRCADLQNDSAHCGSCDNACADGYQCTNGRCHIRCGELLVACPAPTVGDAGAPDAGPMGGGEVCVDTTSDLRNCGGCGMACPFGQVCARSRCMTTCGAGLTDCSGVCRDLSSDNRNCGMCGNVCPAGTACNDSACRVSCAAGLTPCAGVCRDLMTDNANCGACGTLCGSGTACSGGMCSTTCARGFTNCSGTCRDTQSDENNCGTCGHACGVGNLCNAGMCQTSCAAGLTSCSGACRDLSGDNTNCGVCGNACRAGQVCIGGTCRTDCPMGQTNCGGACRDLQNNNANCGMCGNGCATGTVCIMGRCSGNCASGLTECMGVCHNLEVDRAHCGACGMACATGQACSRGVCVPACPSGQTECAGACVNTSSDRGNCGTCGVACRLGEVCMMGACVPSCADGLTLCTDTCRNLSNDTNNCGACGNRCPAGDVCGSGRCTVTCPAGSVDCARTCSVLASDRNNCGACGNRCADPPGAVGVCSSSRCGFACASGYSDCNLMGADGCEVQTDTSATNCGMCGRACPSLPNASPGCRSGLCGLGVCNTGFADCNGTVTDGCEIDTRTNVLNCGDCRAACPARPNSAPRCAAGVCGFTCTPGFSDCDGNPANGCEVELATNAAHCGTCTTACTTGQVCMAGVCRATTYSSYTVSSGPASTFINACTQTGHAEMLAGVDDSTNPVTFGFSFTYYAGTFTTGWVSSNSLLGFTTASPAYANSCLPSGVASAVHAFWDDLVTRTPGVCTVTLGTAPNRQFVFTTNDAQYYSPRSGDVTFSIILNESTNIIDIQYDTMSGQATRSNGDSATIGVQGPTGQATQFSCNTASIMTGTRLRFTPVP